MAFETPDLLDLAFLTLKGYQPTPSVRRGNLVFFTVDIPPDEAERLLQTPERQLAGQYHQAWLRLRRAVDNFGGRR